MSELAAARPATRDHHVNPWLVLVLVCMAQFMVILDATIVNVALPSIQTDLDMSDADLQWIVNAYTLMFGGFLLLGGRAGDLAGRKKVFLVGIVVFTVASLLNGLAPSSEFLIVFRGVQGLGAALIAPAALSIITTTFAEGAERTKAMGVWAAIAVGGGAVGLVLGGVLTTALSWPWIFFVNVPVGIAVFVLVAALRPRVEGRARAQELRHCRRSDGDRRPARARVRDRESPGEGLDIAAHRRVLHARRPAARRVRRDRAALRRAARSTRHLPRAHGSRRKRRHVPRRCRPLRDVLLQHALPPARARIQRARGGSRIPPVHRRDHHRGRAVAEARRVARRPRGSAHRDAAGDRRSPALHAAAAGQLVRHRSAPGDHARVDRDGARVRPDHAHRDERDPLRRCRARVRSLQHVAAGGRRAGAGDPRDARRRRDAEHAHGSRAPADSGGRGPGARRRLPRRVRGQRGPHRGRVLRPALPPAPSGRRRRRRGRARAELRAPESYRPVRVTRTRRPSRAPRRSRRERGPRTEPRRRRP